MAKRIITISREFGSGGRFIGEEVAKKLGIAYYDKNIINEIAEKSGLSPEYVQKNAELSQKATEIADLKGELKNKATESRLSEKSLQEQYEEKLKLKDEQIEYYKDFKARQSTKMIGESLMKGLLTKKGVGKIKRSQQGLGSN